MFDLFDTDESEATNISNRSVRGMESEAWVVKRGGGGVN